ncbi:hypothetical protein K474DRAFT_1662851 [Panus rudis PR-1116 ss-1]|nr:hypothetical protein K474DRAFT_1662851 [Panus rudis PR-1116 ss-1]
MDNLFTPGCPCCMEELGIGGVPPAPESNHRHPNSIPKEPFRKELTQCQNCWKSKSSEVSLFRCEAAK